MKSSNHHSTTLFVEMPIICFKYTSICAEFNTLDEKKDLIFIFTQLMQYDVVNYNNCFFNNVISIETKKTTNNTTINNKLMQYYCSQLTAVVFFKKMISSF